MKHAAKLLLVALLVTGTMQTGAASQAEKRGAQKKEQTKKPEGASLTGCVDEQEGRYVLVDDHDLKVVANLEAEGFPTEGFAKHVGQKVTVRGISNPDGAHPVLKVRSIETVSETCAPQTTSEGKK
jgi:hypothetical protein